MLSKIYSTYYQFRLLLENKGKKGTGSYLTSATGNNTHKTDKNEPNSALIKLNPLFFSDPKLLPYLLILEIYTLHSQVYQHV